MKRFGFALSIAILQVFSVAAWAAEPADTQAAPPATEPSSKVISVLVRVSDEGHITKILPSTRLTPELNRLLSNTLNQWITKPAIVNKHPAESQMVVNVAMQMIPRPDGAADASFKYVASFPAPMSAARWVNDGHELTLAGNTEGFRDQAYHNHPASPAFPRQSQSGASHPVSSRPSH